MAGTIRIGIIGAGWPGVQHARGYASASGFKIVAVADLIPDRRKKLMGEFQIAREYSDGLELIADKEIDAVSVCVPNHLHAPMSLAAIRAGKHILCESPPAMSAAEATRMAAAARKHNRVLLYAMQRRYGGHEQAARAAVAKGMIGEAYHVRCVWTRTRGIPLGTGWFTQKEQAGGGALIDLGSHMLDLAWHLLGQPKPAVALAAAHAQLALGVVGGMPFDVEEAAFGLLRFEGNKSIELAASWALNQPPNQNGTVCRVHGAEGAIEVYTPRGAILYRDFATNGRCKENPLKPPKTVHYLALARHFRDCIAAKSTPSPGGGDEGITLMRMIEGMYRSIVGGKSTSLT